MKSAIILATAAMLGSASTALAFGSDDKWTAGGGQGVAEAIVTKGPGNQIYVTCDDGAGKELTGVRFTLLDDGPKGDTVQLTFDGQDPEDFSIWDGEIKSNCHACAGTYDVVISKMKKHRSVHVRFQNGNAARFTLKGASKAIGKCVADFYR